MINKPNSKQIGDGWEVTVAENSEQVESMRQVWEMLQNQQTSPVTNTDINRYLVMLQAMKGQVQPCVLLVSFHGEPATMVIARIEIRKLACRIGYKLVANPSIRCLTVVYGGVLGQSQNKICDIIINELMDTLAHRQADVVFFNQLRIDSDIYRGAKKIPSLLCRDCFTAGQLHWQTFLGGSQQDCGERVSKKHQRDISRCRRNLEKACSGAVQVVCHREESEIDYATEVINKISALTYKKGLGLGVMDNALHRSLLQQAAKDGWLRFYVLSAADKPVAFEVGYVYHGVYFAEQAAFDPQWRSYSPGTILQLAIFEDLKTNEGIEIYDYGFGDASYKQRFGSNCWSESAAYIFALRPYPLLLNLLFSSVNGLSMAFAFIVNKLGFTARVKKYWRNLIQKNGKVEKQKR